MPLCKDCALTWVGNTLTQNVSSILWLETGGLKNIYKKYLVT